MNEFITIGPKMKKLMLRDMHTETQGETECIKHEYVPFAVMDYQRGLYDEEVCSICGKVKPLDPIDNNTVEVD